MWVLTVETLSDQLLYINKTTRKYDRNAKSKLNIITEEYLWEKK